MLGEFLKLSAVFKIWSGDYVLIPVTAAMLEGQQTLDWRHRV